MPQRIHSTKEHFKTLATNLRESSKRAGKLTDILYLGKSLNNIIVLFLNLVLVLSQFLYLPLKLPHALVPNKHIGIHSWGIIHDIRFVEVF